jgi:hypothetical protein
MVVESVTGSLGINILAIAVVVLFVITLMLPKKIHYIVNGIILIGLGATHILYEFYFTEVNLWGSPIVRFILLFVVGATAKELIKESIHETGKAMKGATFFMGFTMIVLAVIPELYNYGAISFHLPEMPIFFSFVYIIGGVVACVAPFTSRG